MSDNLSGLVRRIPIEELSNMPSGPLDPDADHLSLDELTPEQRAWRVAFHLLALHGGEIHIPDELVPDRTMMVIAEGWVYRTELRPTQSGTHILTAWFTDWNPGDPTANFTAASSGA